MNMASITKAEKNSQIPSLAAGDTVKVKVRVSEGEKERVQAFQGVVIRIRNSADGGTFTVRRVAYGIGVERTFLFQSPLIEKVDVLRHGKVRRAKLYYLRGLSTKAARIKERRVEQEELETQAQAELEAQAKETAPEEPAPQAEAAEEAEAQAEETAAGGKPQEEAEQPEPAEEAKAETPQEESEDSKE